MRMRIQGFRFGVGRYRTVAEAVLVRRMDLDSSPALAWRLEVSAAAPSDTLIDTHEEDI
jgi:hypothetical protein